jgi:thioredoxin 1
METIQILTDDNFQSKVLDSGRVFVVDFFSEWCPPCKAMEPVIQKIAQELGDTVSFGKIDVGVNMQTPTQYGVMAVPTFIIFKGGQEVKRLTGMNPKDKFKAEIEDVA